MNDPHVPQPPRERPRMLEWVGQQGLFANPVVQYNLAFGLYTPGELYNLRERARERIARVGTRIVRILRPDSPEGLSRFYVWGPELESYVQQVRAADARLILRDPNASKEFLDVTDLEPLGPAGTKRHGILLPVTHANPVGAFLATELRKEAQAITDSVREGRG